MGIFDIFKPSKLSIVIREMRKEDLTPQAMLMKSGAKSGYDFDTPSGKMSDSRMKAEINLLKLQKVNILAAMTSQSRFTHAKEICKNHNLLKGVEFMDNYIEVYKLYIKQLKDDAGGGPIFF
jgi:hypothetical protein